MPQRVLVVDDEEAIRDLLHAYLSGLGYRVTVAADGDEGIQAFLRTRPDLVLIDFLLPKKNGFAVADSVRRSKWPATPILMMSGVFKNPKTAVEAKEKYQVIEFLSKPLELDQLADSVRAALAGVPVAAEPSGEYESAAHHAELFLANESTFDADALGAGSDASGRGLTNDFASFGDASSPETVGEIVDGVFHGRPFPKLGDGGALEDWPVALLLSTIRYDRVTGMLDMTNDVGTHRRIYVIDGNPTFMQSNAAGENVGALLLRRGRITEPDFERCLQYMKEHGRTLQQSLLDMRLVTEADLATAYKLLAGQLLPLALGMAAGTYQWRESDAFVGRVPEGQFEPVQVLFEGIKNHVHPPQILKFFEGREDVPLVPTTEFQRLLPFFRRVFRSATVVADIDGDRTYRQLSRVHSEDAASAIPQLFALVTSGMTVLPEISDDNALEVAVNEAASEIDSLDLAYMPAQNFDSGAQAMIERFHAEVMSQDFFQILRATVDTPLKEIKASYFDLAKRWHVDAFSDRNVGHQKHKVEAIFARITEAYETITHPAQRSEYMAYLERKAKGLPTDVNEIMRAEQLFEQAGAMIRRRDFLNAQSVLEEATRVNPDPTYFATLGWVTFNLNPGSPGNLSKAVRLLKKAVQEQGNLALAFQYLGSIAYARGNADEARKWWMRCLQAEPNNIEAARGLRQLDASPPEGPES